MYLFEVIRSDNYYKVRNAILFSKLKDTINDLFQEKDFDNYKCTILMEICIYMSSNTTKYIDLLVDMYPNLNVNVQDEDGITALMIICRSTSEYRFYVLNFFIKKFSNIDYKIKDLAEYDALMYCDDKKMSKILNYLIKKLVK